MPKVAELMTLDPVTIEPDFAALAALDLMIDQGIRHLPVVDRRDRLCGIVSLDDLRAAFPFSVTLTRPPTMSERESALGCAVGEIMTHGPVTLRTDASLAEAASLLVRFRIGCLPVVDKAGRVVGIFSESDALRALISDSAAKPSAPSGRILELELLVAELRSERERIAKQLDRVQANETELAAARREPTDEAERARLLTEMSVDEPLAALASSRLGSLDHALARAQQGRFGVCEDCGREIPIARLRALPGASRCLRCAAGGERAVESPR
jgi:acetoin utilization protein AcuB